MVDPVGLVQVRRAADVLCGLVTGLDPDGVAVGEAPELWGAFGRIERLAGVAQMLLARRVEESSAWQEAGCRSAAEYLSRISGGSVRSARELLRASKKLAQLPGVDAALRSGELSVAQAELIVEAASVDPAKQQHLLDLAGRVSLVELAQECARVRAAADPDPEETYRRIHANRRLRQRTDAEGAWCLSGRGTPDAGALVNHALGPLIDEMYDQARGEGRHEHRDTYAWDAFIALIRRYLDHDDNDNDDYRAEDDTEPTDNPDAVDDEAEHADGPAGDADDHEPDSHHAEGTRGPDGEAGDIDDDDQPNSHSEVNDRHRRDGADSDTENATATTQTTARSNRAQRQRAGATNTRRSRRRKRRLSRNNPRYLALIRIDHAALVRGHVEDDELCEITGLGPIPVSRARQLLSESITKLVITKGVDVAHITHLGRGPTAAQRAALLWRSPSCSNQACGHSFVQIDHRLPWASTRHTVLSELDPLCPHCHRLKTYHGWALVDGTGPRALVPPDDPRHPSNTRQRTRAA